MVNIHLKGQLAEEGSPYYCKVAEFFFCLRRFRLTNSTEDYRTSFIFIIIIFLLKKKKV